MTTPPASIDLKRLAAEVSVQHGIRIDPDDPMMAVVTLNRLVFEQAVAQVLDSMQMAVRDFEAAAEKVEVRAGGVLAQEIRYYVTTLRKEGLSEVGQSQRNSDGLPSLGDAGPTSPWSSWKWFVAGLSVAFLLVSLGIWVGGQLARSAQIR
ncbi:hypothetical protein [Paludibaculum fermentans]|uniref:hypothetical protein n=1 Tax=Paludibaculum fermentans TaxID=1473598 RepID=UPI003EBA3738